MIDDQALATLFLEARSQNGWLDRPVEDAVLRRIYELAKMAPSANNGQPMRVVFVRSPAAKLRLQPALSAGNVEKVAAAPVCAIVAYDTAFHLKLPQTFPHRPDAMKGYDGEANAAKRQTYCLRNGSLAGAFLIMAVRAVGLDAGPMSGFDNAKVDAAFFADSSWRSNFLCAIGHGDPSKVKARLPRLSFDEACAIA